ncbi:FtsX-like permease family protein [Dactylosporangium sp. NPDC000244]|uniref:FtsX-like permease family protein n=1 Tax=Dactylosporangium sp. NPDC000244 TaxID=3154365 RepID=UPI003325E002
MRRQLSQLGLGARLALSGGREGLFRTALTAAGVALGVAVLLLAASLPGILDGRHHRTDGRDDMHYGDTPAASATSILSEPVFSSYHDKSVQGRFVKAEGDHPILPPGVIAWPADGQIVVSPALKTLLESPDGRLLRERFPQPIAGTIGKEGLSGPNELYFYGTRDSLAEGQPRVMRVTHYGSDSPNKRLDAFLLLLTVVVLVALLLPVAMFVAAATRFGGEHRDRRLAAVRLVGADTWMTRRIAAGEALVSATLGVVLGAVLFAAARPFAERFEVASLSVYGSDITPGPIMAALIAAGVPLAALLMTVFALRRVVVEPLGVVRRATSRTRRRVWWRLLLPLVGLALLAPLFGTKAATFNVWQVSGGVILLLIGVSTLLPWVFDRIVHRLGGGSLAWQLALRRLQLSGDSAVRAVNAIAVTAAGAIALQMLFAAAQQGYTRGTDYDVARAQAMLLTYTTDGSHARTAADIDATVRATPIVSGSHTLRGGFGELGDNSFEVVVADCDTLRLLADLPSCADGDVFGIGSISPATEGDTPPELTSLGGQRITLGDDAEPWTVPGPVRPATVRADPSGQEHAGLLLTPSRAPAPGRVQRFVTFVRYDTNAPDADELIRNAAGRIDPVTDVSILRATRTDATFSSIQRGLYAGTAVVLLLVGLSLLVATIEQLRDRRRTLAALVAFGTRRGTIGLSILWQTAVPVALGLLIAATLGITVGAVLLKIVSEPVRLDWPSIAGVTGIAAALVLLVTAASLPPLFRLMRPEGLRFE